MIKMLARTGETKYEDTQFALYLNEKTNRVEIYKAMVDKKEELTHFYPVSETEFISFIDQKFAKQARLIKESAELEIHKQLEQEPERLSTYEEYKKTPAYQRELIKIIEHHKASKPVISEAEIFEVNSSIASLIKAYETFPGLDREKGDSMSRLEYDLDMEVE